MEHLRAVFLRLQEAGLRINRRKCHFATNECEYLGHQVGYGKIRPIEAKVTAIKRFLQPRTKKDVQAFLGVCGCYRKFIPDFATIATPLSSATRKDEPNVIKWTATQQTAFDTLKDRLVNYPVLRTPQWKREFLLQTDASSAGLGYVLSQLDDYGEEHPLAYGSRKLLPREVKYSAIEREGLAIVEGVRHFRVYLEGNPFVIQTDHNPLTHLARIKDTHGRIARWLLLLQPYEYKISYRPGSKNANADGLSREHTSRLEEGEVSGKTSTDPLPDFPGDPERNFTHSPQLKQPQPTVNVYYTNKPHRYTE